MISRKFKGKSNVLGKRFKEIRLEKNLSQTDISNQLMLLGIDINVDGVYKIEKGKRILKDFEFASLCIILGIDASDLIEDFKKELLKDA